MSAIVYVLWGTKKDATTWEEKLEQLITETRDNAHLQRAREWAETNGFINLRVLETFDGDRPDFTKTIR